MTAIELTLLVIIFLVASIVGVVTGSNSLVTVPVMFQFGIDPRVAVATNMFGLTFMAVGATIPFLSAGRIDVRRISPLIGLTIVGSALGAAIVGFLTGETIKLIVSAAMVAVVIFTLFKRRDRDASDHAVSKAALVLTFTLTFLLGIYGGLYSGGYVTILTAMLVAFFGMSYGESVASTKLINVFSSLVATIIFAWQGLIDYTLGLVLGVTMFAGGYIGAHYASRLDEIWLKRIFLLTVAVLAAKTIYDLVG